MKYFVLVYDDDEFKGEFVGLDRDSGGYPFGTDRLDLAKIWAECFAEDMLNYKDRFPIHNWVVREVRVGPHNLALGPRLH